MAQLPQRSEQLGGAAGWPHSPSTQPVLQWHHWPANGGTRKRNEGNNLNRSDAGQEANWKTILYFDLLCIHPFYCANTKTQSRASFGFGS